MHQKILPPIKKKLKNDNHCQPHPWNWDAHSNDRHDFRFWLAQKISSQNWRQDTQLIFTKTLQTTFNFNYILKNFHKFQVIFMLGFGSICKILHTLSKNSYARWIIFSLINNSLCDLLMCEICKLGIICWLIVLDGRKVISISLELDPSSKGVFLFNAIDRNFFPDRG